MMSEPIRILHVFAQMNRGGAETMIMNLYRHIDRTKVQFDFMVHIEEKCEFDDEIISLGGKIFRIPRYNGKNHFDYVGKWKSFFKKNPNYKIIHGHVRSTASIYLNIAHNYDLITIAHSHSTGSRGSGIAKIVKYIMQYPIRYTADYLFSCSYEAGKWLFGNRAIKKENHKIIKNAIAIEEYTFNRIQRKKMRKFFDLEDKFVIGHVGSFSHAKNHKFLIDVFYEVQLKKKNAVLLLVGDGELRSSIEKYVDSLGIKNKVILVSKVPNVNEYLQAMDIFVFPSKFEGLGMAVIEAQASGLPCLVADTIPNEALLTNLVTVHSLNEPSISWAKIILKQPILKRTINRTEEIETKGYNIKESSKILQKFYLGLI